MVIQLCKSDRIEDWQEYLQAQVQDHPTWRSFLHIRTQEIDPLKPICVGYWEGGNSLPNANELIGSGTISDLLKLVDNSKSNNILSQHGGIKARRPNESIRIRYTVHIRNIDDESEEDTSYDCSSSPPSRQKEQPSRRQRVPKEVPKSEDSDIEEETSSVVDSDQETEDISIVKRETNILPTPPIRPSQTLRPVTPAHPALGRKRSLTILSPECISTRTTRELKKTRSATALAETADKTEITSLEDSGDITDNYFELGFQFLN